MPFAGHVAGRDPANGHSHQCLPKATNGPVIQKLQLGAAAYGRLSQRTIKQPAGERAAKQQQRWERIAVEAAEQCRRLRWPE